MYWSRTGSLLEVLLWVLLSAGWWLGGWLIVTHVFRLRPGERLLVGLASGLLLFIVFSNILAQLLPLPIAFWGASVFLVILGFIAAWRSDIRPVFHKEDLQAWPQFLVLGGLLILFVQINQGLAIFDDYFNLPMVSMIATGDVPPHFHLDVANWLADHYGLHLFAAGLMRIGGLMPWSAFDVSKALTIALTPVLAWAWFRRVTRSNLAGFLGAVLVFLGSGTRWLLLLVPANWLMSLGKDVHLIGTAIHSGPDLYTALASNFQVEGGGPFPFPFAVLNGIFPPTILAMASNGALPAMTVITLLLLSRRRWTPLMGLIYGLVLASLALTAEHILGIFCIGILLAALVKIINQRSFKGTWQWGWVLLPAVLLALVGGGVITEFARGIISQVIKGTGAQSYGALGFALRWPPAILSAHLGSLSMLNPRLLLIGLIEIGPILLLAPWVTIWSWKQARRGSWVIAGLAFGAIVSFIFPLVISYEMDRDITRLTALSLLTWLVLGFPLVWFYGKKAGKWVRAALGAGYALTVTAGIVILMIELIAMTHPQLTYFVDDVDALLSKKYWNHLEIGAQVLDINPNRAVTLFGRGAGHAYATTYEPYPEWAELVKTADPLQAKQAGYDYIYMDRNWWASLDYPARQALQRPCVKKIAEGVAKDGTFHWLLDIRACK
jgi:hypothetical protein